VPLFQRTKYKAFAANSRYLAKTAVIPLKKRNATGVSPPDF
jgi:hypothetical protein